MLTRGGGPGDEPVWRPSPQGEIDDALSRVYGINLSAGGKRGGFQVVAEALNQGELARAQIAALLLRLPDPAGAADRAGLVSRLRENGLLAKDWNSEDHPRTGTPPNPGWFAPRGSDADEAGVAGGVGAPLEGHALAGSGAGAKEEVAVQTRNFSYACRALKLDPIAASDALHVAKQEYKLGAADNCVFDTNTGDIIFNGQIIGNLKD
jgi:hypothetical protein